MTTNPYVWARHVPAESIDGEYDPSWASWVDEATGHTALYGALGRASEPEVRAALAHRLLDDGADVSATLADAAYNVLHVLLAGNNQDWTLTVPLLQRLLDGGADPNIASGRYGRALESISPKYDDDELAEVYDVLFSHPSLELLATDARGRSSLDLARLNADWRPGRLARIEEYLRGTGIEPDSVPVKEISAR